MAGEEGLWTWPKLWTQAHLKRLRQYYFARHKPEISTSVREPERCIPLRAHRESPLIDHRKGRPYVPNTIRTSRYTVWDFVPKQIFFQFTRLANFYFLCVGVPQTVPGLSTTGNVTTILPLMFFVLLTIIKEGYDDWKRHRLDKIENANLTMVLGISQERHQKGWEENTPPLAWTSVRWSAIRVGDIVNLRRDDPVPADLILLHASGGDGVAYVETMALDGETSLKTKKNPSILQDCRTIEGLARCRGELVVEDPNRDLYRFEGKLTFNGSTVPLTVNELLHRGTTLRNTEEVVGMVVNTGEECKIRMNANHHPRAKKPAVESMYNYIIITLATYMVTLSWGLLGGYRIWQHSIESKAWFLEDASVAFHEIIIGFFIQFNNVIPLALFVSLEIVKLWQQWFLNSDLEIYDANSDTPTQCNTNTILENLGQISYVLTDKTGTLTENLLEFRRMSVFGVSWYHPQRVDVSGDLTKMGDASTSATSLKPKPPRKSTNIARQPRPRFLRRQRSFESQLSSVSAEPGKMSTERMKSFMRCRPNATFTLKAKEFILAMALCHTCLPEEGDGEIDFQAASADEIALVRAASDLGYSVTRLSPRSITLTISDEYGHGRSVTYQILDIIEFSSSRKRFSIIVKNPDGRIALVCKGADSVIIPRLRQADLAIRMARDAGKNAQLERAMRQRWEEQAPRNSFGGRPSLAISRTPGARYGTFGEKAGRSQSLDLSRMTNNGMVSPTITVRPHSLDTRSRHIPEGLGPDIGLSFLDDPSLGQDETVFSSCFRHLEDYARDGLRTLVYAQKFLTEEQYAAWKHVYEQASTSLTNREELIEEAGEQIEQGLELVGATAIEDRLQEGVPATIDKLRRANIKVWMLTGDKRETAINIAHSAFICKPGSSVMILDSTKGAAMSTQMASIATDMTRRAHTHKVIVIDGSTLSKFDRDDELRTRLVALLLEADSVICCRASPAQKAQLVRSIRSQRPGALTLAIGDGGNDVAMIQEASVGVGISGGGAKEGLQAARVADFSTAQFRFLQRLLLVHGRWNYARTAKFVLATFWKEAFFYIPAAAYQRYAGYTGTSIYEMWSLTVFNTLFTALCVIVLGIWEQDLNAETLLAVPELYVYGQRNEGLNMWKYFRWMVAAVSEGVLVWFGCWLGYGGTVFGPLVGGDNNLFAFGNLAFSTGVVWINLKLL